MILSDIVNRGNIPVLEKVLSYAQARHVMLVNNIANINTPHYKAKQLDVKMFQRALRDSIETRRGRPNSPLQLRRTDEFHTDELDHLVVTPRPRPARNILFHDRTSASIERHMADLAENIMAYNLASQLLAGQFDALKTAIRGQVA